MIIYKDIVRNHEMFSEAIIAKDIEDPLFYVVKGKMIAPDVEEGTPEDEIEKVIDIPYYQGLDELQLDTFTAKMFQANVKSFLKPIISKIKKEGGDEAKEAFMEKVKEFMNTHCKDKKTFEQYSYYIHNDDYEHLDNCFIVICKWEGETPLFYFWKDGLKTEKC
ncbi:Translationally controlled tumor protein-like protein [Spironucleus salmonicida]|uniref:Translationally controlled tumor protein-like protein n=1 Tax=Spironucleus salmonicida TaxID=348837 RepID=V6LNT7_9EUKA|nr:Translationally controlled tumor protein-like protein [Spironucleus salmonicida]|eukprot:EST45381.1 Translationally controlled tumor protein-like protein [Spironucleus salmonicida]